MKRIVLLGLLLLLSVNSARAEENIVNLEQISIPYAEPLSVASTHIINPMAAPVPINTVEEISSQDSSSISADYEETTVTENKQIPSETSSQEKTVSDVKTSAANNGEFESSIEYEPIELDLEKNELFMPDQEKMITTLKKIKSEDSKYEFSMNTKSFYTEKNINDIKSQATTNDSIQQEYKLNPQLLVKNNYLKNDNNTDNTNIKAYVESKLYLNNGTVQSKFSAGEPASNPHGLSKTIRF